MDISCGVSIGKLGTVDISSIRKRLTVQEYDRIKEETVRHKVYLEDDKQFIMPRDFGVEYFADRHDCDLMDLTCTGRSFVDMGYDLPAIRLWDYQRPFVSDVLRAFNRHYDILAQAATGTGKTIMSLEIARKLGRTTGIIVDQEFLMAQWRDSIVRFLGIKAKDIGIVQGKECDYKDKPFVIMMMQTLFRKEYPEDFYKYFGHIIFDEAHTAGAPVFSKVLFQFPAAYRLGVSATPDRKDYLQKVLEAHLGKVRVALAHKHRKSIVKIVGNPTVYSWYANISPKAGRYIAEIVADKKRNARIVQVLKWLYDSGRHILIIGDRVAHLEELISLSVDAGIPAKEMVQITGKQNIHKYMKDLRPSTRPDGWIEGTKYTPVVFSTAQKTIKRDILKERKEGDSKLKFATYSMFSKGVDIPGLDAGIDVTPRSKATQVHGRILREVSGKSTPIWVTIFDYNSYRATHQLLNRISDYHSSNAEIHLWKNKKSQKRGVVELTKELRERLKYLKSKEIHKDRQGGYVLHN